MPQGKWRQFSFVMECKSVITRPSGGMALAGPGIDPIEGFAWSGNGTIRAMRRSGTTFSVGERELYRAHDHVRGRLLTSDALPRRKCGAIFLGAHRVPPLARKTMVYFGNNFPVGFLYCSQYSKGRVWYTGDMTRDQVKEILDRVLTWPADDQEKVARFVRGVEQRRGGDDITEEEWKIIEERAARRDLATDEEVEEVFSRYRSA
jgi:hypothetical protein